MIQLIFKERCSIIVSESSSFVFFFSLSRNDVHTRRSPAKRVGYLAKKRVICWLCNLHTYTYNQSVRMVSFLSRLTVIYCSINITHFISHRLQNKDFLSKWFQLLLKSHLSSRSFVHSLNQRFWLRWWWRRHKWYLVLSTENYIYSYERRVPIWFKINNNVKQKLKSICYWLIINYGIFTVSD